MTRLRLVSLFVICMFLFLILGLFNLEVVRAKAYKELSDKNCIKLLPMMGARGKILDRNGEVIVSNRLSYEAMILPQKIDYSDGALSNISNILSLGAEELKNTLNNAFRYSSLPVSLAKNLDAKKAIALEEAKFDIPNLVIQPKPARYYPYEGLACHLLGYVSEIDRWRLTKLSDYGYKTKDVVGFGGVEEKYDYYLRQEEGGISFEVDHRGRFVRLLGFRPAHHGQDLQLTLDLKIQNIIEDALKDRRGAIIIMDPYTGELLAMASSPGFGLSSVSSVLNNTDAPFLNRATAGIYPPGSIFKIIVATAALETKKIDLSTSFVCPGYTHIGGMRFGCWDKHDKQNIISAIARSCNVFFYKTGLLLGVNVLHDYALKFGLSRSCSFELGYEEQGSVPSPLKRKINKFKKWYDGDTANFAIGQGELLVTPLQMVRMIAVFANKGNLVTPYLVSSIGKRNISAYQRKVVKLPIRESTIQFVREGLRDVVANEKGTGNVLSGLSIPVAGKTGTAQAPPGNSHAWFVGFFPYQEPKYAICVLLEQGGPGYISCVLAGKIIKKMISEGLI